MARFTFDLSDKDFDRLFEIKDREGKDNLSGNDFARLLLERELYRLCPIPKTGN